MLPALAGFAAKALLPSTKKVDKDKLLNRKSSAIERTKDQSKEKNIPVVKRATISTDKLLKPTQTDPGGKLALLDSKGKGPTKKSKNIIDSILVTLVNIQNLLRRKNKDDKKQEEEKIKLRKKKEAEKSEETLEGKKGFSFAMPKIKVPNIPFIDQIMNFFGNILIGSLVLFIYKNIEEIIKFFQDTFLKIQEFFKLIEPIIKPIWDGLKWIVGGGANIIAKILGVPSQEADTNGIKKNLEEITKKIPIINDLFKGIQNTVNSIRGYKEPTDTGAAGGGTPTASGDLFQIIAGGEGGYNSVNRGNAGDTPGGAQSIFGKPLTEMTVGQVVAAQQSGKVFAVGKYQIIPDTMPGFLKQMKIPNSAKFDEATQEKFKDYVINFKRPEVGRYIRGETSNRAEAAQELAREFASVGLSYAEAGRRRGQSRYSGTAGNRASISPESVEAALDRARSGISSPMRVSTQQKQQKADAVAQQAAQQAQTPTPTPATIPQVAPTQAQVSISQAQVSPSQPSSPVVESVPQIMQQADYETPLRSPMILPIPVGGNANTSAGSMGGGGGVIPVGLSKREALNSYYQAQLMGFLYKQG